MNSTISKPVAPRPARHAASMFALAVAGIAIQPAGAQTRSVRTPLVTQVAGNVERYLIVPNVSATYDSNYLRLSDDRQAGSKDNIRVTPGVSVSANRLFGRIRATVAGSLGYDFNTRYKGLDNKRIDLGGSLTGPVGAKCTLSTDAHVEIQQFDLDSIDQGTSARTGAAESRVQSYELNAGCGELAGFSPVGSVAYRKLTSDRRPQFNYDVLTYTGGVAFSRPSLGRLTLTASQSELNRYNIPQFFGFEDNTKTQRIELALDRAVSLRLQGHLAGGYVRANPERVGVRAFSGLSFDGQLTYAPVPRLSFVAQASRDVQSQNGFNATYTVVDTYGLRARYALSARSAVNLNYVYSHRDFRGEQLLTGGQLRGADTIQSIAGGYTLDIRKTLRFGAGAGYRRRNSENSFYDYNAISATVSVGARF